MQTENENRAEQARLGLDYWVAQTKGTGQYVFRYNNVKEFLTGLMHLCDQTNTDDTGDGLDFEAALDDATRDYNEQIAYEQHNRPHTVLDAVNGEVRKIERGRDKRVISVGDMLKGGGTIIALRHDSNTASGMYAVISDSNSVGAQTAVSSLVFPNE